MKSHESWQPRYPLTLNARIRHVSAAPAHVKKLALEESNLAAWIANTLRPHVDELIVCDPRPNALISRGNKDDVSDAIKLCRLYRMGELSAVYHTDEDHRVDFKIAVQPYLAVRRDPARLQTQIKAKFGQAGVVDTTGTQIFTQAHRDRFLDQVPSKARRRMIGHLYAMLDATGQVRKAARADMIKLGRRYPEIQRFQCVPGIGIVGSHVSSAFIQTPRRFATKQKLWRLCIRMIANTHCPGPGQGARYHSKPLTEFIPGWPARPLAWTGVKTHT